MSTYKSVYRTLILVDGKLPHKSTWGGSLAPQMTSPDAFVCLSSPAIIRSDAKASTALRMVRPGQPLPWGAVAVSGMCAQTDRLLCG